MDDAPNITVERICDRIGRRAIADAIGVRLTSVSNAVSDGRFPARWFDVMERMCAECGLPCPRHLFSFIGADSFTPNNEFSHVTPPEGCADDAA